MVESNFSTYMWYFEQGQEGKPLHIIIKRGSTKCMMRLKQAFNPFVKKQDFQWIYIAIRKKPLE